MLLLPPAPPALEAPAPVRPNTLKVAKGQLLEVAFATVKPGKESLLLAEGLTKMQPLVGRHGGELQGGMRILAAFADKQAPAFQALQFLRWSTEGEAQQAGQDAELKAMRGEAASGFSEGNLVSAEKAVDVVLEPGVAYAVIVETVENAAWDRMRGALEGRYKGVARFQAPKGRGPLGLLRFTLLKVGPAEGLDAPNWGRFLPVPDGGFVALAVVPKG
ncbi:MAG TPA: hypothetical protein VJ570_02415 [Holophagaceae bacterium]|nr:hypothetical protein [Holophagaceae bacterium]